MGTPEFAVSTLDAILQAGHHVVAVITAADKPAGRGMKLTTSAVKNYAVSHHLPVLQPEKLKNPEFLEALKQYKADLQVVVAFRMLPELVWSMPPMGTINVHASLLPQYRGAAPINWAIMNGERISGVTTFKLSQEIDTGNILLQQQVEIGEDETAGELYDKLKTTGAQLAVKTIEGLMEGIIKEQPQNSFSNQEKSRAAHAPKIYTETCNINWGNNANDIYNLIRGLCPFPGAFTRLQDKLLKIYKAKKLILPHSVLPGSFETDQKTFIRFACSDGYIYPLEVQAEGKKKMAVEEFLKGLRV